MPDHIQIGDRRPWEQYQVTEAGQSVFPFHFPVFKAADVEVYVNGERRLAGYAVLGAGASEGGSVVFDPAVASCVVTIRRRLAIERTSDFQESGEFRARVLNDELDYQTAIIQQIADDVARTLRLPATDPDASLELPAKEMRKGKFLWFDPETGGLVSASGITGVPISAPMEAVVQAATTAVARALMGLEIGVNVEPHDSDILRADTDDVLAAAFGQGYQPLGSLDAMANDILTVKAITGSNRKTLTVDVDGTIDVSTMAAGAVLIRATNVGTRALTFVGATLTEGSGAFVGMNDVVNLMLFESDGTTVDLTIDQRGA
ncbi:hypothetical protein [Shumkonia mesophila]|uniref:hypothetical protein n=1 Tax=Shumkonia mesophila TaxID=2838854 RepID=UPI00293504B6|nr:hypothetical protein [Shumkonia mesophila]